MCIQEIVYYYWKALFEMTWWEDPENRRQMVTSFLPEHWPDRSDVKDQGHVDDNGDDDDLGDGDDEDDGGGGYGGFEGKGWGVWILFLSEFAWKPFSLPADQLVNTKVDNDDHDDDGIAGESNVLTNHYITSMISRGKTWQVWALSKSGSLCLNHLSVCSRDGGGGGGGGGRLTSLDAS